MSGLQDATYGDLARFSGNFASGHRVVCQCKAYRPSSDSLRLKWECRWLMESCGYVEDRKKKMWKHISENWPRWQAAVQYLLLDPNTDLGKSLMALRKKEDTQMIDGAEQDHWFSTRALVALLATWARHRRQVAVRDKVRLVGKLFLEACCQSSVAEEQLKAEPLPICLLSCQQVLVVGGRCSCLRKMLDSLPVDDNEEISPQGRLFDRLLHMVGHSSREAVKAYVYRVICRVADSVQENIGQWADYDWHKTSGAHLTSQVKRRRIDFHVKKRAVSTGVVAGEVDLGPLRLGSVPARPPSYHSSAPLVSYSAE